MFSVIFLYESGSVLLRKDVEVGEFCFTFSLKSFHFNRKE